MAQTSSAARPETATARPHHRLSTRIWHWTNVVAFFIMVMSGLQIFNAHPMLYWGSYGANADTPWLEINDRGDTGFVRVGNVELNTTGILGKYTDSDGNTINHAFPGWSTIPSYYSLADGRLWHLFFAWIFAFGLLFYMVRSLWNRHVQRDLHLKHGEWRPSHLWTDIKEHARLEFRKEPVGSPYNTLQKLAYVGVLFILMPIMILTGLTMSPAMDANWGFLLDLFGGRQSARSIHFITMWLLLGFFLLHIALVVLNRPVRHIAGMVHGGRKAEETSGEGA